MTAIKFTGFISTLQPVSPSSTTILTWEQTQDGDIRIKEVTVAFDQIIQTSGLITLSVAGYPVATGISMLSNSYSFTFDQLDTVIAKGSKIVVTVQNQDTINTGNFQLLVNSYQNGSLPNGGS